MLRLDWNILFNVINLIILYFLIRHFLFKPINAIIAKRQEEADSCFVQADAKEAEAKKCREQYESLLQDVENEKKKIVSEARQEAAGEYGRIVDEAKEKAAGIVDKAREDAGREKQVILQQADTAVRDMVLTAAAKMVGASQNADSDKALYDAFLAKADGSEKPQMGE